MAALETHLKSTNKKTGVVRNDEYAYGYDAR